LAQRTPTSNRNQWPASNRNGWPTSAGIRKLSERQKLLIRDAIGHAYRGLFGLAGEDIIDLTRDEAEWADRVAPDMVSGITKETLRRALNALKHHPAQTHPIFR
jgi:hypothetical protein